MSTNPEELIKKYLNHTCTPEERTMLESWYNAQALSSKRAEDNIDYEQLESDIWTSLAQTTQPAKKTNWTLFSAAAACILLCSLFYFSGRQASVQQPVASSLTRILPGSNKAELLLEDGSVLPLSDDSTGALTKQNGALISRLKGGSVKYSGAPAPIASEVSFNTLRTPKGGQYQVELPDGTRAWLNAASSLRFPTVFDGAERTVEAMGEVYFEVAVNKHKPFKVVSPGQTIVVLGTHFNLNTYTDEQMTRTSLLEGSVKVLTEKKAVIIKPGEQTIFNSSTGEIVIRKTDAEEVIAWRQGYFQFDNEDIKSIMRKLSRWYDIDVEYSKDFVNQSFSGSISRFEDAAKVLKMLEYTGSVHFKAEGRRVTVMP